jgi:hypothetical protein
MHNKAMPHTEHDVPSTDKEHIEIVRPAYVTDPINNFFQVVASIVKSR